MDPAAIQARGDALAALLASDGWQTYVLPYLVEERELARDRLERPPTPEQQVTPLPLLLHQAYERGRIAAIRELVAQLAVWRDDAHARVDR